MKRKKTHLFCFVFLLIWMLSGCKQTAEEQIAESADFVPQQEAQTPDPIETDEQPVTEETIQTDAPSAEEKTEPSTAIELYPRTPQEATESARRALTELYGDTLFEDFKLQTVACELHEDDSTDPTQPKIAAFYTVRFAQLLGKDGFIQGLRFNVSVVQNSGLARRPDLIDLTPYYAMDPSKFDALTKEEVDRWVDTQMEQFGVPSGSEHIEYYQIAESDGKLRFEIFVFCHENKQHIEKYLCYPIEF